MNHARTSAIISSSYRRTLLIIQIKYFMGKKMVEKYEVMKPYGVVYIVVFHNEVQYDINILW